MSRRSRRGRRPDGPALVRAARAARPAHRRPWLGGVARRCWEFAGELADELLAGLFCLALLAGVITTTAWGWAHSEVGTAGVYAAVVAFLAYGIVVIGRSRRREKPRALRRPIATAAAATAVFVAVWLTYVVQYAF